MYTEAVTTGTLIYTICLYKSMQVLVGSAIGDYLLFRDFGPYGIIFMNVCVVTTVAMVLLLRNFGPYTFYLYVD
jgi:hypothetical protein